MEIPGNIGTRKRPCLMPTRLTILTLTAISGLYGQIAITNPGLPAGTLGVGYASTQLTASGGTAPYTWSAAGLPAGLAVSGAGVLSGMPIQYGAYQVTLTVKDSAAAPAQDTKAFALNIAGLIFNSAFCQRPDGSAKPECELGDTIILKFQNLDQWCASKDADLKTLDLILNGRVMPGLRPIAPMPCNSELRFDLKRLDDDQDLSKQNRAAWNALLAGIKQATRTTSVNVGVEGKPICFGQATFTLRVYPWYTGFVYVALLVLLLIFLWLAANSDIVRDLCPFCGGDNSSSSRETGVRKSWRWLRYLGVGEAKPTCSFSLARCQMAWWFFIVVGAYLYIWLVTGDRDSLTPGVLILIGISAATGFSSMLVDNSKQDQRVALEKERASLTKRINDIQDATASAGDKAEKQQKLGRLAEIEKSLAALPPPPGKSEGFFQDILRDEDGVSFHRFQMAVWTVVLGGVFIRTVWQNLSMPDFSSTLLGLMGISSGTYVGFKIPHQPKPGTAAVPVTTQNG
jgi:hypothetical protein